MLSGPSHMSQSNLLSVQVALLVRLKGHATALMQAGRFAACWNILVLAYVCYQLRRYPNADPASTSWQFAHPLDPCLIRFLESQVLK